jgi:methylated-DNA-protein-cysteine methyltransferase-like protein
MNDYKQRVYKLVKQIPKGKVTTYGEIAKKLHMSPRTVGTALHLNPYEGEVPCHRVVNRDGRIAPGFAFGGIGAQRKLLEREGVEFKDETHLDLSHYFVSV